ncbi:MAG TPA: glycosyltransferase family 2 protein [Xanthomonadaceae bacterium]|nr:glycosyltransferase family 2 protein [Xanthomonadaceae bacterium]
MSTALTTSIALCTYNGERFLQAQLDSLLAQTRLPDQIVVFDDASQDGTWLILEAFAQQARQRGIEVLLRRQPVNVGYVRNFEAALAECSGEIVFLCDQDDVWHSDKIERMAQRFEAEPGLTMLHTDARLVDADGRDMHVSAFKAFEVSRAEIRAMHAGRAFDVLLNRSIATGATMAVRVHVVRDAPQAPAGWIHDEWLALVASLAGKADTLDCALIDYRQHGGNQIGAKARNWRERLGGGISRGVYMHRIVQRAQALLERTGEGSSFSMPGELRERVEQRLAHAAVRLHMPASLVDRLPLVTRETTSGRYWRYSSGWRSVISDLAGLRR